MYISSAHSTPLIFFVILHQTIAYINFHSWYISFSAKKKKKTLIHINNFNLPPSTHLIKKIYIKLQLFLSIIHKLSIITYDLLEFKLI